MPTIPITDLKKDLIFNATLRGLPFTFATTWGLFSPEKIDEGTKVLLEKIDLKENQTGEILDLGCGYGPLGIPLAKLYPNTTVHMIDKDFVAIAYAKKNAVQNSATNTQTYLSNGFDQVPKNIQFQTIVSNLPAKISKEFFWILFEEAHQHLLPGGEFYVVTISGLSRFIEKNFNKIFGNYELLANKGTYFVAKTTKQN
ncbi:MAG: methyltransferase [Patescibacteria group bacterium]